LQGNSTFLVSLLIFGGLSQDLDLKQIKILSINVSKMLVELTRYPWLLLRFGGPQSPLTGRASLFYINFWKSKLILHKAITGLGSEWWPTTRPGTFVNISFALISFYHTRSSAQALSWGTNSMER